MKLITALRLQLFVFFALALLGLAAALIGANATTKIQKNRRDLANTRAGVDPSFKGTLGMQLCSLRAEFSKDVPGTLAKVREMGFREVEMGGTYGLTPQQFRAELDKAGLRAVSMGVSFDSLRDNI